MCKSTPNKLSPLMVFPNIFLRPRSHGFTAGVGVRRGELIGLNRPQFNIHFVPYRDAAKLAIRINCTAFKKQFHFVCEVTARYESRLSSPPTTLSIRNLTLAEIITPENVRKNAVMPRLQRRWRRRKRILAWKIELFDSPRMARRPKHSHDIALKRASKLVAK